MSTTQVCSGLLKFIPLFPTETCFGLQAHVFVCKVSFSIPCRKRLFAPERTRTLGAGPGDCGLLLMPWSGNTIFLTQLSNLLKQFPRLRFTLRHQEVDFFTESAVILQALCLSWTNGVQNRPVCKAGKCLL